eukprot:2848624-Karenia_brevis.AAC.1
MMMMMMMMMMRMRMRMRMTRPSQASLAIAGAQPPALSQRLCSSEEVEEVVAKQMPAECPAGSTKTN